MSANISSHRGSLTHGIHYQKKSRTQHLSLISKKCTTNILSWFNYKKKEEIIDERNVVGELNNQYFAMDLPGLLEVIKQVTSK